MQKKYIICEEISKNIMRKNILLIDEQLDTCNRVKNTINYLYNSKNAFFVLPCTIYFNFSQNLINSSEILYIFRYKNYIL
jgi:hypothetical protein